MKQATLSTGSLMSIVVVMVRLRLGFGPGFPKSGLGLKLSCVYPAIDWHIILVEVNISP